MENLTEKQLLIKIAESIEKKAEESSKPPKRDNLPLIIAMIGFFVSVIGYFFNQIAQNNALKAQYVQMEEQAENELIMSALENGKSALEKKTNLIFLCETGLISDTNHHIANKLQNSIITPKDEILFLDEDADEIIAYNLYSLAYDLVDSNDFFTAIPLLNKSIKLNPNYYSAATLLGYSYRMIESYDKAIIEYTSALIFTIEDKSLSYLNRGICYKELGQNELACKDFESALTEATKNNNDFTMKRALEEKNWLCK